MCVLKNIKKETSSVKNKLVILNLISNYTLLNFGSNFWDSRIYSLKN